MAVHLSMIGVFRARKHGRYSAIVVFDDCGINGVYKRHGGSVPFSKGCHASGGVCIPLAEPAQINPPSVAVLQLLQLFLGPYLIILDEPTTYYLWVFTHPPYYQIYQVDDFHRTIPHSKKFAINDLLSYICKMNNIFIF